MYGTTEVAISRMLRRRSARAYGAKASRQNGRVRPSIAAGVGAASLFPPSFFPISPLPAGGSRPSLGGVVVAPSFSPLPFGPPPRPPGAGSWPPLPARGGLCLGFCLYGAQSLAPDQRAPRHHDPPVAAKCPSCSGIGGLHAS